MCGRARCTLRPEQVVWACGAGDPEAGLPATVDLDKYRPSYNVSPGAYLPVVAYPKEKKTGEGGDEGKEVERRPVLHCMKWGIVPSFTKKTEKPDHYKMFNARSESICEKASFRRLVPNNRCLVAAEGFYEWKKDGSKKQPYYIHFKDERPLVFAALYDSWQNAEGELLYTFTILTTCSSLALQWLHDRMPVILGNKASIDLWLNSPISEFGSVIGPYEGPDLVWYPVSPAMGKPQFDGPECIKEIQSKPAEKILISKFFSKKLDDEKQPQMGIQETKFPESREGLGVNNVKEDADKIENRECPVAVEDSGKDITKPHVSHQIKETEICSSKRGYGCLVSGSCPLTESVDDSKRRGRAIKRAGDGQATLFSYFGKG